MKLLTRDQVSSALDVTEGLSYLHSGKGMTFNQEGDSVVVSVDKKCFQMTDDAFVKAARVVGVPATYVNKIPKELFIPHLRYWYGEGQAEDFQLVCKDDTVLSVTRRDVDFVSNQELLANVEEGIGGSEIQGYARVSNDLSYTHIDIVGNKDFEVLDNDMLYGGVRVQNSILGEAPVEISAFVFRLVCSNGAMAPRFLYKWSRKNRDQRVVGWAKDAARTAYSEVTKEFGRVKALTAVKIEGFVSPAMKSFLRDWGLPVSIREEVFNELVDAGAKTLYDVWCAISKIATHSERNIDNPLMRRRMQLMAGDVVDSPHLCNSCHQVLHDN